ncbi:MAG: lipopolysaccharide biosynthesis protein [Anaerolineae bacterium]|nr:lipopolysaccharide biosynthesis protein [Anaerolineae bacterium]
MAAKENETGSVSGQQVGRAVSWKAIQHGSVKLIYMVRLVVLARLLAPDDFGLLAISTVAIDFLLRLTEVGMMPALIQRQEVDETHYDVAWTVGIGRALLIGLVVIGVAPYVAAFMGDMRAVPLIRLLALRPLLQALTSIKTAHLTRTLQFRRLAWIYISEAVVSTGVAIALARPLGVWALIIGGLAGPAAQVVLSYLLAPYRPRLRWVDAAARSLIQFGRWVFVISLVSIVGTSILRAVISRELGAAELGLYYLAASLAFLPAEIASEIIGPVAFPLYARLQNSREQIERAFRAMITSLMALLLPGCVLLIILAPTLVSQVLGASWQGTVLIIQLLALVNIIGLIGDMIAPILNGHGQPARVALVEVVQSGGLIIGAWFLTGRYGVVGAAAAWLPAVAVSQLVSLWLVRPLLPHPLHGLGRPFLVIAVVAGVVALAAQAAQQLLAGLPGLIAAITAGGVIWVGLLGLAERHLQLGLTTPLVAAYPRLGRMVSGWRSE